MLPRWQGQGFATEAAAACRDFARDRLGAEELIAIVHPENHASTRVAAKIGMHRENDDRGNGETVCWVLSPSPTMIDPDGRNARRSCRPPRDSPGRAGIGRGSFPLSPMPG